jgi:hypothetical protein
LKLGDFDVDLFLLARGQASLDVLQRFGIGRLRGVLGSGLLGVLRRSVRRGLPCRRIRQER